MARWGRRRRFSYRPAASVPAGPKQTHRQDFGDWWSFLDAVTPAVECGMTNASRTDEQGVRWSGGTFQQVMGLAKGGWAEGTARIVGMTDTLTDKMASTLPRDEWTYDVSGAILDIGRFCSGEPEHWVSPEPKLVKSAGQGITVVFNGTASGGIDTESMFWKGAAVAALVKLAEMAGRPTRVVVHFVTDNGRACAHASVVVKEFGDAVDVDRLAFALAHPGSLRKLGFAAFEMAPVEIRQALGIYSGGGYGQCAETPEADRGDIYVKSLSWGETELTATEWVRRQLVEQGIIAATDEVAA